MPAAVAFSRARDHPRWKTLVEKVGQQQQHQQNGLLHVAPAAAKSTAEPDAEPWSERRRSALGPNYSAQEHTLRNDYSQHFVDTGAGRLPGNAVRNPFLQSRFEEYPKLKCLVQLKDAMVTRVSHPPTYLKADLIPSLQSYRGSSRPANQFHLGGLIPVKYDVVLIDPPLEAYEWEGQISSAAKPYDASAANRTWSWDEIAALPVPQVAAKESFVFLWVGSGAGDGLERGREVLAKWGYRRCEDIVCIRTNPESSATCISSEQPSSTSAFTRSVQHCLMGIRGTVRRSSDTRFVHCNIDTDVMFWSGDPAETTGLTPSNLSSPRVGEASCQIPDMKSKPPELYQIIENFCLGTRRLELFGRNRNLRRGWLTIGLEIGPDAPGWPANGRVELPTPGLTFLAGPEQDEAIHNHLRNLQVPRAYVKADYDAHFKVDRPGCDLRDRSNLLPYSEEVDQLRPKSPQHRSILDVGPTSSPTSRVNALRDGKYNTSDQTYGISGGVPNGLSSNHTNYHAPLAPFPASSPVISTIVCVAQHSQRYPPPPSWAGSNGSSGHFRPIPVAGGAGLSGLGAGGDRTVSIPSGSDTLSGPQASVLKAKAVAEAAAAAANSNGTNH